MRRPQLQWSDGAAGPVLKAADWRSAAACRTDPDLFFGPDGETTTKCLCREAAAKALCAACPVRSECLRLFRAIGAGHGVWAGMGETDRGRSYAGSRIHKPAGDQARLEAIREAGERPCSGACGQIKPLDAFARHGGVCKACLGDQMREINRRRRAPLQVAGEDERTCTQCDVTKPVGEFHRRPGRHGPRYESRCKACRREARRERWAAEKAERAA